LDHYDPENRNSELSVQFVDCKFENNKYYGTPAQPSVIVGNGRQNRLIMEKNEFIANDMVTNNTIVRLQTNTSSETATFSKPSSYPSISLLLRVV